MPYCNACGAETTLTATHCPSCGTAAARPAVVVVNRKEPFFALALSFLFAGLGQFYNGEVNKGIGFLIAHIISLVLIMAVVGVITTPIIWIWGMVDAYKSAQRINFAYGIA